MRLELPWIKPFDTLDLPNDFEDQIRESFKKYTRGTSTRYTWKDKMLYISHLPLIFKGVIDLIQNHPNSCLYYSEGLFMDEGEVEE